MKKINLKHGLGISKSKIAALQDEHLQQVKGGNNAQLTARTKGPKCSCDSNSCNTGLQCDDIIIPKCSN